MKMDLIHVSSAPGLQFTIAELVQILPTVICIRLWMVYYDYMLDVQTLASKWKTAITHKEKTRWAIRHRWLGDLKVVIAIGLTFALLCIVFIVLSQICHISAHTIIMFSLLFATQHLGDCVSCSDLH